MKALASLQSALSRGADLDSPEGRAHERKRRVLLSALSAGSAKAVSLLVLLLTVPLTLSYLGAERYGIWMAVSSLLAVLSFADLGLGYGLINTLAQAEGMRDASKARAAVSSAFFMLLAVSLLLSLGLALAWRFLDWGLFFNARSAASSAEAGSAMAAFAACFLLGLPLTVVTHSYAALQQGFRSSLYQMAGSLLSLGAILIAVKFEAGLPWLVFAASGLPLLATAMGGWDLYHRRRPELLPRLSHASRKGAGELARLGGLFFVIQVSVTLAFQSDALIITRILGPESVALYAVTQKLFLQVPFVVGYFLTPLWPAYSEALARKDYGWIKRILRKTFLFGFAVNVPAALALYLFAPWVLQWWVKGALEAPPLLLLCLAVWAALNSINGPLGMFLNGTGALKFLAASSALMAAANLGLSVYFTRRFGIAGVVMGSIVAQALFSYLPSLAFVPGFMRRMEAGRA